MTGLRRLLLPFVLTFLLSPLAGQPNAAPDIADTFRIMTTVGSFSDIMYDARPGRPGEILGIGRIPSARYQRPSGNRLILYRMSTVPENAPPGSKPEKTLVADIPLPEKRVPLIIVVAPQDNDKLTAITLTDDPEEHPAGTLRLINLSGMQAMVALNEARHEVKPNESTVVPQVSGDILVQVAVAGNGGWALAFRKERLSLPQLHSYGFIFNYAPDPELGPEPTPPPAIVRLINERLPAKPEKESP